MQRAEHMPRFRGSVEWFNNAKGSGLLNRNDDPDVEEQVFLLRLQNGDTYALAALYDDYSRLVYSVALRVLRDPARAEDVLQDVFLKIWRSPASFLFEPRRLGTWLAVIARNSAVDLLRHRESSEVIKAFQAAASIDIAAEVERTVLVERIRQMLSTIPKEQMEMAFFQERHMSRSRLRLACRSEP